MAGHVPVSEAVDLERILAAESRLKGEVRRTPLLSAPALDAMAGRRLLVKAECLQHTGSFKFRGGWAALSALPEEVRGVVAASSGNHAQGIALAAARHDKAAVIVMPSDAPGAKISGTRALGAELVLYDRAREDRNALCHEIASARGFALIPPFDHPEVIAGQASVGLELAEQARGLAAEVLVCCGGGGLSAGIALALEARAPQMRLRTVEPEGFEDMARALATGTITPNAARTGLCDAILTPEPGGLTLPILRRLAGRGLVVTDVEVLRAMALAFAHLKLVIEPGGAVALAAALFHPEEIAGDTVVVIASGGNVDADVFIRALEQGACDADR
ncbi:MAG: threonine/serine dehydratase [Rhodobacteraceae bacterium]|nr:MAG: threonine/serine dehydratase [Paracoccaceae bacterium]